MGDQKSAIDWFRQAVEDGFNCYPLFEQDPNLDSLRGIQEFKELLAAEQAKYNHYKAKFGIGSPPRDRK